MKTIAVIATLNPARGDVSAILYTPYGRPPEIGPVLLKNYTRRGQVRNLVNWGNQVGVLPHPDYIRQTPQGLRARRGSFEDIARWADKANAQWFYFFNMRSKWNFQRVGPKLHGWGLQPLTTQAIDLLRR
jgi:hypothetical protein